MEKIGWWQSMTHICHNSIINSGFQVGFHGFSLKYCTAMCYIIIGRPKWDRQILFRDSVGVVFWPFTTLGASFGFTTHRIVLRVHLIYFWTCHQIIHKTQVSFSSCLCTWSVRSYFVVDWNEWSVPKQGEEIIHPPSWPWPYLQFLLLTFLSCVHFILYFVFFSSFCFFSLDPTRNFYSGGFLSVHLSLCIFAVYLIKHILPPLLYEKLDKLNYNCNFQVCSCCICCCDSFNCLSISFVLYCCLNVLKVVQYLCCHIVLYLGISNN